MSLYHQILVPVDGSPTSDKALDEAIQLARAQGARLRLLYVIDEFKHTNGFEPARTYFREALPLMHSAGKKLLAQGRQKAEAQGVKADSVLVEEGLNSVYEHVEQQAGRMQADLIVVGSHGRRGLGRLLLGSDAEQIVRHSRLPVLVVRATPPEAPPAG
jgi:nucleotide-binding universal stress UspA family protein